MAFLSQRSMPVSLLGVQVELPVALLTVIAFEAWRYSPSRSCSSRPASRRCPQSLDEAAVVDGATPTSGSAT